MEKQPRYEHDCDQCIFLGYHVGGEDYLTAGDVYFCPQSEGIHTIVVRHSDEGSDYSSGALLIEDLRLAE